LIHLDRRMMERLSNSLLRLGDIVGIDLKSKNT
jgi:hypothetical protein